MCDLCDATSSSVWEPSSSSFTRKTMMFGIMFQNGSIFCISTNFHQKQLQITLSSRSICKDVVATCIPTYLVLITSLEFFSWAISIQFILCILILPCVCLYSSLRDYYRCSVASSLKNTSSNHAHKRTNRVIVLRSNSKRVA